MNTQGEGILFVQTCFCFQFQPVSSLANLHTCRLYRGSLALAEAESSSGRRPVALLDHLDRTDLKVGGYSEVYLCHFAILNLHFG